MTSPRTVRIATRSSPLALWQAEDVASRLRAIANVSVEIVRVSTQGDRRLDVPLADIGGKGVFVSEVQASVLDASADIAVHSAKDMPAVERDDLAIAAFLPRADPRDAVVGSALSKHRSKRRADDRRVARQYRDSPLEGGGAGCRCARRGDRIFSDRRSRSARPT